MRAIHVAVGLAIFAFALLYSGAPANVPANVPANLTLAINSTRQYVESVNESSYLLFYPNLTYAYNALGTAVNVSRTNATEAYELLKVANTSAADAQRSIYRYALDSLYALAVISVALAALLFRLMQSKKKGR
jgi:hypothetical protein